MGIYKSINSKMPFAYCGIRGSSLKCQARQGDIPCNSICSKCYAARLEKCRPNLRKYNINREDMYLTNPSDWFCFIMCELEKAYLQGCRYVRCFDFGDLLDSAQLLSIVHLANEFRDVKFWLPTKNVEAIDEYVNKIGSYYPDIPRNLIIRISEKNICNGYSLLKKDKGINVAYPVLKDTIIPERVFLCPGHCDKFNCRKCWGEGSVAYLVKP